MNTIIKGVAEGSRWKGFRDPNAPVFLQYEVFKYIDLRDSDNTVGDSSREPAKPQKEGEKDLKFQYAALYSDEFARHYGVADEENPGSFSRFASSCIAGWCMKSGA